VKFPMWITYGHCGQAQSAELFPAHNRWMP
jgi:hypothetical protein